MSTTKVLQVTNSINSNRQSVETAVTHERFFFLGNIRDDKLKPRKALRGSRRRHTLKALLGVSIADGDGNELF